MNSIQGKYVQIQKEKVGDILHRLISFFVWDFQNAKFQMSFTEKKMFVTTPFISSLFNF